MKKIKLTATNINTKDVLRQVDFDSIHRSHENDGLDVLDNKFSRDTLKVFVLMSVGLFVAFVVGLEMDPLGTQRYIWCQAVNNLFADFFNQLRYIVARDPYFNPFYGYCEKIYFPLTYMCLYPFSQLDNFGMMSYQETLGSRIGLLSCFVFIGFSVFLLVASLNQIVKKYSISSAILISLALSYVFIFSVERANVILISAACVGFFICNYDSEDKRKRIWAAVSLALATALKIYPALFIILYLAKKQYREIFFCVIVTLLLVFVPYLFLKDGFVNIPQHIGNIIKNSVSMGITMTYERFSLPHLLYCCSTILRFPEKTILSLLSVAKIINMIVCIVAIIFSCIEKNKWLKISLLTMVILFLPTNSGLYCGLYTFPMIIMFFSTMQERSKVFNIFTLIVFIVFLNPFMIAMPRFGIGVSKTMNYLIANIFLLSLYFVLLISSGKHIIAKCLADFRRKLSHVAAGIIARTIAWLLLLPSAFCFVNVSVFNKGV